MTEPCPFDHAFAKPVRREWNDPPPPEEDATGIKWSNWAAAAGVLVLVFVVIGLWPVRLADPTKHPAVGHSLSDLRLEGLTGTQRPITSDDLRGQVALISFWSSTDAESTRLLSHLLVIFKRLESRADFAPLLVSYQPQASLADLRSETATFLESAKVAIPTYWDPEEATLRSVVSLSDRPLGSGPVHLPVTVLLDREGTIRGVWYGYTKGIEKQIARMVAELLGAEK
jgi:cytochrome oxidase Cu insertion factor (SCO1/SenC/PrrC family)